MTTAARTLTLVGTRTPHATARPTTAVIAALAAATPPAESDLHGAACTDVDPGLFYGPDPDEDGYEDTAAREFAERRAKAICWSCPVRGRCLALAMERKEPEGVWGGLTARERRRLTSAIYAKRTTLAEAVAR
ncbi:WhiB family transcriptional regulator [Kitasatospora sp. GAS1066B]|uniref:WhiB family transcriptional regulator n=1 Tax=Kitasatospora sp. GAS1066B TaxID=3156271 RepID=UPI003516595E